MYENNTCDIWILPFTDGHIHNHDLSNLSDKERQKSQSFFHEKDKTNYQLSHLYLRKILTRYCQDIAPKAWQFEHNKYGKPSIALEGCKKLHFNISHTDSHFAMIVSNTPCGIDIETGSTTPKEQDILDIVLTKREQELVRKNRISFYTLWTLKEAYLKATGSGLSIPLTDVEFLASDGDQGLGIKGYSCYTEQLESSLYLSYAVYGKVESVSITKSL